MGKDILCTTLGYKKRKISRQTERNKIILQLKKNFYTSNLSFGWVKTRFVFLPPQIYLFKLNMIQLYEAP